MRQKVLFICLLSFMLMCGMKINAQEMQDSISIVDHILSDADGKVTIMQPEALLERLKPSANKPEPKQVEVFRKSGRTQIVGYRVQVFSDNNHRTAKNEALIKERNIISRFPQIGTYLSYKAPAWRLRVGDFREYEDAQELLDQIKRAFPGYAREVRIVKDRINISL